MHEISTRMEHLRLRDLMLLARIDELGSLGAVAREMNVTQPAVTQALQGLEQAFGTPLVDRGRRGVALRPTGRAALERLNIALQEVAAAHQASAHPAAPLLRLGVSPTAAVEIVPAALTKLRATSPGTRVHLIEAGVPELWQQLADGELDAIVSRYPAPVDGTWLPPAVQHEPVGSERMVIVGADRHPLARRRATPSALAACDWVLPPPASLAGGMFQQWFTEAGLAPPAVVFTSMSFHTNLRLVAAGGLLTIAPESAVQLQRIPLKLKVIATPWTGSRDIVLAHRSPTQAIEALRRCFSLPARSISSSRT